MAIQTYNPWQTSSGPRAPVPGKGGVQPPPGMNTVPKAPTPGKGAGMPPDWQSKGSLDTVGVEPDYRHSQDMFGAARQGYLDQSFGYNPYETGVGPLMQGMNYNPYRTAATNQASSQAVTDYQSLLSNMSREGGLSASDRMNAAQNFNRSKILGQLAGGAKYDQAQSESQFGADRMNAQRALNVQTSNAQAANEAAKMGADMEQRKLENLYGGAMSERNLGRQLEAAKIISDAQKAGASPGMFDWLFNGVDKILGN